MYNYWDKYFFPLEFSEWPDYIKNILWPVAKGLFQMESWLGKYLAILVGLFFPVGLYAIYRKDKFEFMAFSAPLLVASIAAFKIYPPGHPGMIGARLSLYLYPVIVLISGYGILKFVELFFDNIPLKIIKGICALLVVGLLVINVLYAIRGMGHQQTYELFEEIYTKKNSSDILFVYSSTKPALDYWLLFNKKKMDYVVVDREYFRSKKDKIVEAFPDDLTKDKIYIMYSHFWDNEPDLVDKLFQSKGYGLESTNSKRAFLQYFYLPKRN